MNVLHRALAAVRALDTVTSSTTGTTATKAANSGPTLLSGFVSTFVPDPVSARHPLPIPGRHGDPGCGPRPDSREHRSADSSLETPMPNIPAGQGTATTPGASKVPGNTGSKDYPAWLDFRGALQTRGSRSSRDTPLVATSILHAPAESDPPPARV